MGETFGSGQGARRRAAWLSSGLLMVGLAGAACETVDLVPPTGPTPVPTTQVFTGTLTRNGAVNHPFATQAGGTVTATLVALSPEVAIGLDLGTWNGIACQSIISNANAQPGTVVTGTATGVGNLCVRIYDSGGRLTADAAYEVSVRHP